MNGGFYPQTYSSKTSIISNNLEHEDLKNQKLNSISEVYLLQTVIESFVGGILILTAQGELVHS
ncbi:hypothetical protein [Mastigocoleus testarum]|uniref:Uncharacterized protein n=1 Tax=Mastigocoleus testarum BC008 TaxID=371196 RepID=A0A0V7ZQY9_9CYAN|nr:hypothetical protein [Mastigocoleus testarum]KST64859.1 hypothetical protein BC008_18780 [Mastigocoleus testarum BC008]KST67061.1 hypothetical protein BC008_28135 [Mastigocoleus testarum BC008]